MQSSKQMGSNAVRLQLEQFIDKFFTDLDSLPAELRSGFAQMQDLDQKSQDLMSSIDQMSTEFLTNIRNMSSEKKSEHISRIQKMYNRIKEYSDDKVQIAIQTYELVDKHIQRLDSDMVNFESDLKPLKNHKSDATVAKNRKKAPEANQVKKKHRNEELEGIKKRKKRKEIEAGISSVIPNLAAISNPGEAIDMPVDPNEPTYCLCHQVSYGEMIACDKPDCPIEWFHFACVNLTTKPKGKWYCPRCTSEKKKR